MHLATQGIMHIKKQCNVIMFSYSNFASGLKFCFSTHILLRKVHFDQQSNQDIEQVPTVKLILEILLGDHLHLLYMIWLDYLKHGSWSSQTTFDR